MTIYLRFVSFSLLRVVFKVFTATGCALSCAAGAAPPGRPRKRFRDLPGLHQMSSCPDAPLARHVAVEALFDELLLYIDGDEPVEHALLEAALQGYALQVIVFGLFLVGVLSLDLVKFVFQLEFPVAQVLYFSLQGLNLLLNVLKCCLEQHTLCCFLG